MAFTCARCGTQNPDGNQFCQACGAPLAVTALPGPPPPGLVVPGPPPMPPPPPAGYQSPYYAPSAVGPQPPVHRTPWMLIIAAIVGLVLIMAGCGTAIAVLGNRNSANQGSSAGILPSPSPAGTPSPGVSPKPTGSGTSNQGETFVLPAGWVVVSQDDQSFTVTNPNGNGSITIGSGPSNPAQTAVQNKEAIDKFFADKYPDTRPCPGTKTTTGSLNGVSGISWELCFTLSAAGQSIAAAAPLFAAANSDGSIYYAVLLLTAQSNLKSFVAEAAPILHSIRWKLS